MTEQHHLVTQEVSLTIIPISGCRREIKKQQLHANNFPSNLPDREPTGVLN